MFNKTPYIIFNPDSAGGKSAKKTGKINSIFNEYWDGQFILTISSGASESEILVRNSIQNGYELIVAVGGDGTIHHVANGFFYNGETLFKEMG
jgi:diacylglycerol kinase (ATP)